MIHLCPWKMMIKIADGPLCGPWCCMRHCILTDGMRGPSCGPSQISIVTVTPACENKNKDSAAGFSVLILVLSLFG